MGALLLRVSLVERVAEVVQVTSHRLVVVAEELRGPARPVLQGFPDRQRAAIIRELLYRVFLDVKKIKI